MKEKINELKRVKAQLMRTIETLEGLSSNGLTTDWGKGYEDGVRSAISFLKLDIETINTTIRIYGDV